MKKFQTLGTTLSKEQAKKIKGGNIDVLDGCGTNISCAGKKEGDTCGTDTCLCETNSATDKTLYCTRQG